MTSLHIDFETRSAADLRKTGVYVYAEDPTTDVWCAAYAVGDEPVKLWVPDVVDDGDPDCPQAVRVAVMLGTPIVAHNANFERALWAGVLAPRYGWPLPKPHQWRCTMAMALAMALPPGLGDCAKALGLDVHKDDDGKSLMLRMAKPRKVDKETGAITWWDVPDRLERLYAYCKQDVEVERAIERHLLPLRKQELDLWHLDQACNDRGIYVDRELCNAALQVVNTAAKWLNDEIREITDGAVTHTTKVADIRRWLASRGVYVDKLDKEELGIILGGELAPDVRRVVEIRQEAAKAAVKKISALLAGTSSDDRARGLLQFHAASTGRWAGRRFQPQNIARPKGGDIDGAIDTVRTGSAEFVRMVYGEPLATVSDCLRGLVGAAPGNTLYAADFSNIEGRLTAWLAGEEWKLQAFRDFDAGIGHDIYHITAGKVLGKDPGPVSAPTITKEERQGSGKVPELALGYQGGVGAFQKMAVIYGVHVTDERADEIKVAWRDEHPMTVQFWGDLENAATNAIQQPGVTFYAGARDRIAFRVAGTFLYMRLPSGRAIVYPFPKMKMKLMPWTKKVTHWVKCESIAAASFLYGDKCLEFDAVRGLAFVEEEQPVWKLSVCYKGVDPYTRQWSDQFAHGGLLANNAVQGTARDIEAEAMPRVENAGYPITLSVHDEIVCETPKGFGSVEEFEKLMVTLPAWADGLPLAASAWSAERYRK